MAFSERNSLGFWFAASVQDDTKLSDIIGTDVTETWETTDLYAFFYRTRMLGRGHGETRFYGGWTGDSDGLIGAETRMPLTNGFALETRFMYLIPDEERGAGGNLNEGWNLGLNLAWYPGSLMCGGSRYIRPLFDVADNGSMIPRRQ
jgi:hypothetical protein